MLKVTGLFIFILIFTANAYALCVKSSKANVRSGPGTSFNKTWEVYRYMPFRKLGRRGSWIKIRDVDGDRAWIHRKLTTSKYKCAVVKSETVNLRTGPGVHFPKSDALPKTSKYTSFRVIKTKRRWVEVKDDYGDVFWVHRSLVWIN